MPKRRLLTKDGKEYHAFCAVFKGTTTLADTITDIKSVIDGFYEGGRNCADSLKAYINSFEGADGSAQNSALLFLQNREGAPV